MTDEGRQKAFETIQKKKSMHLLLSAETVQLTGAMNLAPTTLISAVLAFQERLTMTFMVNGHTIGYDTTMNTIVECRPYT